MDEDVKLIQEVLNGNIDSFNILLNKYELMVLKFVYNIIKDREAAEDIAQEVFITVYNKLYTYNKDYKFSNWLLQISRNKCIDYIRKYKRVYESNLEDVVLVSREVSPEEHMEFMETRGIVEGFLTNLSDIDRHIITLKYSEDSMTFCDIAVIMDMSESSVKRRYYKIRDRFRDYLIVKEKRCK